MTTTDRLAEIEARLSAATPGPWEAVTDEHKHAKEHSVWADSRADYVSEWVATRADADLLANAPVDLAALVAVVREVEALHAPDPVDPSTCRACSDIGGDIAWPCPTAAAVQKLGGGS